MKLTRQKTTIEAAIANILNVVLRILGYEELEAVVQLRITTGKLSPEERQMIITEFDKGLLSKATAIALLGSVDDCDAELALIAEEAAEDMRSRSSDDDDGRRRSASARQRTNTAKQRTNRRGAR
jgi:hypothetical protein